MPAGWRADARSGPPLAVRPLAGRPAASERRAMDGEERANDDRPADRGGGDARRSVGAHAALLRGAGPALALHEPGAIRGRVAPQWHPERRRVGGLLVVVTAVDVDAGDAFAPEHLQVPAVVLEGEAQVKPVSAQLMH